MKKCKCFKRQIYKVFLRQIHLRKLFRAEEKYSVNQENNILKSYLYQKRTSKKLKAE